MKINPRPLLFAISLIALTLFACGLAAPTPTTVPGLMETMIAGTLQVMASPTAPIPATDEPPLATITSAPLPPTNTSAPVGGAAVRIKFATGATSGIQEGQLQPGQSQRFLVGAAAGQPLMVSVSSLNNDVTFSVSGVSDGHVLLAASEQLGSWQTMLTTTQDYLIQAYAGAKTENFTLNIITPARIKFAPEAVSAKLSGATVGGLNVAYVIRANAGQKLKLTLAAPKNDAVLSMYGYQDGQPYLRYVVEQTDFDMTLPATQDYIIQVVPRAGAVADYDLIVEIK